jgi:hypothetical protein
VRFFGVAVGLSLAAPAGAQVAVSVVGNQAFAQISLPSGGSSIDADVTITFDTPVNLTPASLNLTAQLVDPDDATLKARLPACVLAACVDVPAAFPLLITVEPPDVPWLFRSGFETADDPGLLAFLNTYEFEIHTPDLDCTAAASGAPCPSTPYRLFKAPLAGAFVDATSEVLKGSVRARGRGGAFSQFLIAADARPSLLVELDKALQLNLRIVAAALGDVLSGNLLGLLQQVQLAVLALDYATAIARLDELIAQVQAHAGIDIANVWSADHSVVNDAGEIEALARTLRYTLVRLQGGN